MRHHEGCFLLAVRALQATSGIQALREIFALMTLEQSSLSSLYDLFNTMAVFLSSAWSHSYSASACTRTPDNQSSTYAIHLKIVC